MKKHKLLIPALVLALVIFVFLGACGNEAGEVNVNEEGESRIIDIEEKYIRRYMFGKYYVSSLENAEQELLLDFEAKLLRLCFFADIASNSNEIYPVRSDFGRVHCGGRTPRYFSVRICQGDGLPPSILQ